MPEESSGAHEELDDLQGGDVRARAEAAILVLFLSARAGDLIVGAVCSATSWRSYRRPRLMLATLGVSVAESAWLARRCWRRGALDEALPAWVDGATAAAGLVALAGATKVEDRTSWVNWMCPLSFSSIGALALGLPGPQAAAGATILAGTYLGTATSSLKRGGSLSSTALANTLTYAGIFPAIGVVVRQMRRSAIELEEARGDAIESAQRLATEHERSRQYRLVHDSALQTLEAVAAGWGAGTDRSLRERARHEVTRLRRALRGDDEFGGLVAGLGRLVEEFTREGIDVELWTAELDHEPLAASGTALCNAAAEAMRNAVKHAGTSSVVVRSFADGDVIAVTIEDHGVGFDPNRPTTRLGVSDSIIGRMRAAGGDATISSAPGSGTVVTLTVPR